jgi:hypothetical protein
VFLKAARELWWTVRHQPEMRAYELVRQEAAAIARAHPDDDAAAAAELRAVVTAERAGARLLVERLALSRETAGTDRIHRLVRAALDDAPVAPVDLADAAFFARLQELDAMPIGEAFRQLADLQPALNGLVGSVGPDPIGQRRRVAKVVGPKAEHADPVIRAFRTERLVDAYLRIAAGNTADGDATTPWRDVRRNEQERWAQEPGHEVIHDERTGLTQRRVSGEIRF